MFVGGDANGGFCKIGAGPGVDFVFFNKQGRAFWVEVEEGGGYGVAADVA